MDETWLYNYDPETKQQRMESRQSSSPASKNSEYKNPLENFSPQFFWDQDGFPLIDYIPKGQNVNAEYYSSLLVQLTDVLKEEHHRKFIEGVLLLHDKAPANRALGNLEELAYLGFLATG